MDEEPKWRRVAFRLNGLSEGHPKNNSTDVVGLRFQCVVVPMQAGAMTKSAVSHCTPNHEPVRRKLLAHEHQRETGHYGRQEQTKRIPLGTDDKDTVVHGKKGHCRVLGCLKTAGMDLHHEVRRLVVRDKQGGLRSERIKPSNESMTRRDDV